MSEKSKSINFLKVKTLMEEEKKKAALVKWLSAFLMVFYCLCLLAVFSFNLVTQREMRAIEEKMKLNQKDLEQMSEVESLYLLLKKRLSLISEIVSRDKIDFKDGLMVVQNLNSPQIDLEEVAWLGNEDLNIEGKAAGAAVLADFLASLSEAVARKELTAAYLISASREDDGFYKFEAKIRVR